MGVRLSSIDVCHASKIVSNDVYLEHFKRQGKDIKHLLVDVMGRDKRYMFDDGESSLILAINAAKTVLKNANLEGNDIDALVYSSILSEYIVPVTSLLIHKKLHMGANVMCIDVNANCAGMAIALENMSNYLMSSKHAKRALIIGCDDDNALVDPNNELCYGNYGHAACAMILEKVNDDCGLIDNEYYVHTSIIDKVMYPSCGFSSFLKSKNVDELYLKWQPFDSDFFVYNAVEIMTRMLKNNGLTKDDISMFCFSQLAVRNIEKIRELMNIDEDRSMYIGNKYGYTGTSSPFIALYESIKKNKVKRGDYIMIWTFAAGSQGIVILYKY
ncbi:3-oxoacyl-[acyl-carrier-protein] synthase III C-terminal domain-containing protein [Clostridium tyrobutyricum]|uniref:3-oxoacyl-[acyl-carrier-protein] synthase III C-terminal domain-containing protein n=1 Tax=Clostridium tyrobutyricum TaxID=1519 RepID=UPI0011C8C84F|nr:3-oxoacyl-[acyl-carrier-protein] synthase III C-terminal domain-containing protein [Clostridium tyrobutyricum]